MNGDGNVDSVRNHRSFQILFKSNYTYCLPDLIVPTSEGDKILYVQISKVNMVYAAQQIVVPRRANFRLDSHPI